MNGCGLVRQTRIAPRIEKQLFTLFATDQLELPVQ